MNKWILKIMDLVNDYCINEFDNKADFSDLSNIGLAYTTIGLNDVEIQVSLNLVNKCVVKYIPIFTTFDGINYNVLCDDCFYFFDDCYYFDNYKDLYKWLSQNLFFDYLTSLNGDYSIIESEG